MTAENKTADSDSREQDSGQRQQGTRQRTATAGNKTADSDSREQGKFTFCYMVLVGQKHTTWSQLQHQIFFSLSFINNNKKKKKSWFVEHYMVKWSNCYTTNCCINTNTAVSTPTLLYQQSFMMLSMSSKPYYTTAVWCLLHPYLTDL